MDQYIGFVAHHLLVSDDRHIPCDGGASFRRCLLRFMLDPVLRHINTFVFQYMPMKVGSDLIVTKCVLVRCEHFTARNDVCYRFGFFFAKSTLLRAILSPDFRPDVSGV